MSPLALDWGTHIRPSLSNLETPASTVNLYPSGHSSSSPWVASQGVFQWGSCAYASSHDCSMIGRVLSSVIGGGIGLITSSSADEFSALLSVSVFSFFRGFTLFFVVLPSILVVVGVEIEIAWVLLFGIPGAGLLGSHHFHWMGWNLFLTGCLSPPLVRAVGAV